MPPAVENKFLYALKVKRKVSNEESFNYLWLLVVKDLSHSGLDHKKAKRYDKVILKNFTNAS